MVGRVRVRVDSVRGRRDTTRGGEPHERCTQVGAPTRRHGRAIDVAVAGSALTTRHSRKATAMNTLHFTAENSANGIVERDFTLGEVTGVLWSPESGADHASL